MEKGENKHARFLHTFEVCQTVNVLTATATKIIQTKN